MLKGYMELPECVVCITEKNMQASIDQVKNHIKDINIDG